MTAAEQAAAAAALGITVPAWKTGQKPYFDMNPAGNTDSNPCASEGVKRGVTVYMVRA